MFYFHPFTENVQNIEQCGRTYFPAVVQCGVSGCTLEWDYLDDAVFLGLDFNAA